MATPESTLPVLTWTGKTNERCRESRPVLLRECFFPEQTPRDGWRNLLIRADNRLVLSSLLHGPLRREVEARGGLKLIYCDPPFAVGANFTMPVAQDKGRAPSKERPPRALAYSDQWQGGLSAFLCMLHERLLLMRELLAPDGSLYLHCDRRTAPYLRLMLDEVFGPERFLGDIVWHYTGGGRSARYFSRKHDRILHYAASEKWIFNPDAVRVPYKPGSGYAKSGIISAAGKRYAPHPQGTPVDDVWDIPIINPLAKERCGYPTQKPESLLERILLASSRPGDLVADFFCGSGTTAVVAEKLGRAWIAVDNNPLATHTTRKRLLKAHTPRPGDESNSSLLSFSFALAELGSTAFPCEGEHSAPLRRMHSQPDGPGAWLWRSSGQFPHLARLTEESIPYALSDIRLRLRECFAPPSPEPRARQSAPVRENALPAAFSLELISFAVAPGLNPAQSQKQEKAQQSQQLADFFARHWHNWLDYWSVGVCADSFAADAAPASLCSHALWHAWADGQNRPVLQSPVLSLPFCAAGEPGRALVLRLVDIFANETCLVLGC